MKKISSVMKGAMSCMALTALWLSGTARAIDVDPLDYVAAPPGVNLAILYAGFIDDHQTIAGPRLDANINIARFVAYREFMGITVDPQVLLPFGTQNVTIDGVGQIGDSGLADPIFAATFWFVNDEKNQFGITPFVTAPIGSYDNNRAVNLGTNNWTGTLQFGWVHKPTPKLGLEIVGDVKFATDNDEFGPTSETVEYDEAYQLQLLGSYKVSDSTTLGLNLSTERQADTTVNGFTTPGAEIDKASVYAQFWIAPTFQLQALNTAAT